MHSMDIILVWNLVNKYMYEEVKRQAPTLLYHAYKRLSLVFWPTFSVWNKIFQQYRYTINKVYSVLDILFTVTVRGSIKLYMTFSQQVKAV